MATVNWKNSSTSGNWFTASNWSTGQVPNSTSTVSVQGNGNTAITISNNTASTGSSLSIYNSNLSITNGALYTPSSLSLGSDWIYLQGGTISASSIADVYNNYSYIYGYGAVNTNYSNHLNLSAQGGTLVVSGAGYYDNYQISANSTLELGGTSYSANTYSGQSNNIVFLGANAILKIDDPTHFLSYGGISSITGFAAGDKIDLVGIRATSASYSGNTLTVNQTNGQQYIIKNISGSFSGYTPTVTSDGNGGTFIGLSVAPSLPTSGTVTTFLANAANIPVNGFVIYDTSANIVTNLDTLQANIAKISYITQTGTVAPLSITANQLANDASVFGHISGSYTLNVNGVAASSVASNSSNSHITTMSVRDSAANLVSNLDTLQNNLSKISTITVSNGATLSVSSAQASNDASVLSLIRQYGGNYTVQASSGTVATFLANVPNNAVNGFVINDTSANIAPNLDALQANIGKISYITQIGAVAPLSITANQLANDASVFGHISGSYSLNVSGVSAGSVASHSSNSHITKMSVSDTAANLVSNLDTLQNNLSKITSVTVANGLTLSVSSEQASKDYSVLSLITQFGGSYIVQAPTSGTISTFLANTSNSNGSNSFAISDTSANVASNLDVLQANLSKISAITLSGNNSPMAITATQLKSDASVLAKISDFYTLAVSATPASLVSSEFANAHVTSVSITDTAANFIANLNAINAKANYITSITLTDSHVLGITASQQTADAALLSKIIGGYSLSNTVTLSSGSTYNAQPNQTITGVSGLNKVVFSAPAANFSVSITGSSATLVDNLGSFGTETLNKIQRVQFNDGTAIALDFQPGQNAYSAAMIIGTAFGASKVSTYFAPGVSLVDAGQSNIQIASTIQQLGLIESAVGSNSNTAWVGFIYKNVVGVAPDLLTEKLYVNNLNNGAYTKASLLALAINAAENGVGSLADQINLVGLQANGLSYHPGLS